MYCKTITKEIFDSYIVNDSDTILQGVVTKLLFVNTDTETVEVEYTADACEKLNLPKGEYQVYFVGKDLASFQANINLYSHSGDPNWQVDEGKEGALNPTR